MNVATLVDEAVAAIHALPEKTAAPMRAVRVALSKKLKGGTPEEIFDAAQRLKSAGLDWMGWELIYANKPALKAIDIAMVEALGQGMASWQQTDGFGMILVGPAWLNGRIADDDVRRWARSTDIWWRRRGSTTNRAAGAATPSERSRSSRCCSMTART